MGSVNNIASDDPILNDYVRSIFTKRGFKIADRLEDSSVALMLHISGDIDMNVVSNQIKNPSQDSLNNIVVGFNDQSATNTANASLALEGSTKNGNKEMGSMGKANLIGQLISTYKQISLFGSAQVNPSVTKGFFGGPSINKEDRKNNPYIVLYAPINKGDDVTTSMKDLFDFTLNHWIDAVMVVDPPVVADVNAASSIETK